MVWYATSSRTIYQKTVIDRLLSKYNIEEMLLDAGSDQANKLIIHVKVAKIEL